MIKHYMTKYVENGELVVESWIQIDFFRYSYCFSRQRMNFKFNILDKKNEKTIVANLEQIEKEEV